MKNNKLEIEMKKLAEEYHFNLFNLQNNLVEPKYLNFKFNRI